MLTIFSPQSETRDGFLHFERQNMHHEDRSSFRAQAFKIIRAILITDLLRFIVVILGEECTHEECLEQATRLTETIDPSVDPCDDFVEFACGNTFAKFDQSTDVAVRESNDLFAFNILSEKRTSQEMHLMWMHQLLQRELNKPYRIEEHRSIGLAKMYWQSCKITSVKEALAGVRILFKRLGGWPLITKNWHEKHFTWDKFSKCARLLGFLPRMFVRVGLNDNDVEKSWYSNDTIELTIERSQYINTREDMITTMERGPDYYKIAEYLAEEEKPDKAEIEDALQFAKRIHMLTYSQEMPIVEQKIMSIGKLQKTYPFINWMDYIRSMLTRRQANYLSDRNCVIVDVCYLSQIGQLLANTTKRLQANYAFLSIIDDLFLFIRPQLSLTFASSQNEIERICFESVISIFTKAIEMILAIIAGQSMKMKINEIQSNVAKQAHEIFQKIPWMDHQTQLQARKKSERTVFVNLFEDSIFEDRYFDRLVLTQPNATLILFREVNVFLVDQYYLQLGRPRNLYILHRRDNQTMFAIFKTPFSSAESVVRPDRISNQVYIPAGAALEGRFSILSELDFLNYAIIGLQIANAMGHQIYQRGSFIDENGNWRETSWWSKATQKQFASRTSCNNVAAVKPLDDMSPIFGYIGAAEIAYKAMFENLSTRHNTTLPGLKYTTRQLFWISAVSFDCDRNFKRRYNAMVGHNFNFAIDFNCPPGSNMNVTDKCKVWIA